MDPEVWIRDRVCHSKPRLAPKRQQLLLKAPFPDLTTNKKILSFIHEMVNREGENHKDCACKRASNTFKNQFSFHGEEKF